MVITILILVLISIGYIRSIRYKRHLWKEKEKNSDISRIFYPLALWIIDLLRKKGIDVCREENARTIRNLNLIAGDDNNLKYTVRKMSLAIMVMVIGCIITILYSLSMGTGAITSLMRPGYGMEVLPVEFYMNGQSANLELQPMLYDFETVQQNFELAYQELLEEMPGENVSLSEVSKPLSLLTAIDKYAMSVSWHSSNSDIVDQEGNIHNRYFKENQTENVTLTATLKCQDYECIYDIDIMVVAEKLSTDERILRGAEAIIQENNLNDRLNSKISLPAEIEGVQIAYEAKDEPYEWLFLLGTIIAAMTVFFGRDSDLRKADKERKNQMLLDYPEIVSKLTILMGAGMSVRSSWEKIVHDYRKKGIKRYAYEEMVITCHEISSGELEGIAYSNFGKRCNIHEYLKLGAMLEQNVKSGTRGLAAMLESEAWLAFEVRKNTAVKLGEEAGTKLLMPMILMLAVVLVIVMVPALMSLGL